MIAVMHKIMVVYGVWMVRVTEPIPHKYLRVCAFWLHGVVSLNTGRASRSFLFIVCTACSMCARTFSHMTGKYAFHRHSQDEINRGEHLVHKSTSLQHL